ncbi:phage/plasmid replication protein, II/X family [Janthinobacterium sp. SUN026]|uniref:phage/plasmid replication protein, II/X family n=1 Tax=Janthinobacterium sp. SUN026 TaxID=3002438 RepID=UPI0025B068DB|nr:phage/plasmid replication protein, II/X family [Janthinobacterium sp. SUN026]MDN2672867.1 phage/plasmid replication protein, II/X family [Janthinobacterium sp. SUN026]
MGYDTIKLRSPPMDASIIDHIQQQCLRRSGVEMATGQLKYEIFSGELSGSWDSRISVLPKYEEYVINKSGRPQLCPCEPYVLIEASVHKIFLGHNVYGGPTDFQKVCGDFIELVGQILEVDFLPAHYWTVHRVDVAETFRLSMQQCIEFFQGVQLMSFPRRSKGALKTNHSFHFPGKTTVVKGYHKGSEFRVHERGRLRQYFSDLFMYLFVKDDARKTGVLDVKRGPWVDRKLEALQRLADKTLRLEVGVNSDKFQYDFGKNPRVSEVTDAYLEGVYDREVEKLLREGKQGMDTVRNTKAVLQRLKSEYGDSNGMRLYGFWNVMCTLGDEEARKQSAKATFYRNRKLLEEAGVSWRGSNVVVVANDGALPADFSPVRTDKRLRFLPARNRDEYQVSRKMLQAA